MISSCSLWIEKNKRKDAQLPWRQPYADTKCVLVAVGVTHQPQACCQIFDFLVDEAAELKLAFLAFDWLFILRLCALHTGQEG